MASDTVIVKVFIPQTKAIVTVLRNYFHKYDGTELPFVEALLDGTARQEAERTKNQVNLAIHERAKLDESYNSILIDAFVGNHAILARCFATEKTEVDPCVRRNFAEACQYPGWSKAIDGEYNALVSRDTWEYVRLQPGMRPVPYTWVFLVKPLDAEGKKFMEKTRCSWRLSEARRGRRQQRVRLR